MNYKCTECGARIFGSEKHYDKCPSCGCEMESFNIEGDVNAREIYLFIRSLVEDFEGGK
jgi:rubrerythrin